ncbi:hypothetical protein OROHE_011007 [Orobanche hederae]
MRKLKFHEKKLLKKVNFFQWKREGGHRENLVISRYHVTGRDDYKKYSSLCRTVQKLVSILKQMGPGDPYRIEMTDVLLEKLIQDIASLQNEDGSFVVTCGVKLIQALCSLAILHRLDKVNVEGAVNYNVSCKNLEGGFGCTPGAESHAGQKKAEKKIEPEKLAPKDDIYVKTSKRKSCRQYKTPNVEDGSGEQVKKPSLPNWLLGRSGKCRKTKQDQQHKLLSSSTSTDLNDLKKTIREEIMVEMQEMVDRKVSEK